MIKIITKSLYFLFLSLFVNNLYSQDTKWKELFKNDDLSEFIILNGNAISKLGDIDGAGQTIFASVLEAGSYTNLTGTTK